ALIDGNVRFSGSAARAVDYRAAANDEIMRVGHVASLRLVASCADGSLQSGHLQDGPEGKAWQAGRLGISLPSRAGGAPTRERLGQRGKKRYPRGPGSPRAAWLSCGLTTSAAATRYGRGRSEFSVPKHQP